MNSFQRNLAQVSPVVTVDIHMHYEPYKLDKNSTDEEDLSSWSNGTTEKAFILSPAYTLDPRLPDYDPAQRSKFN